MDYKLKKINGPIVKKLVLVATNATEHRQRRIEGLITSELIIISFHGHVSAVYLFDNRVN